LNVIISGRSSGKEYIPYTYYSLPKP